MDNNIEHLELNCNASICIHAEVCKYKKKYIKLLRAGIIFNKCKKFNYGSQLQQATLVQHQQDNTYTAEQLKKYMSNPKSLERESVRDNIKTEVDAIIDSTHKGTCALCGTENTDVITCSECGIDVCIYKCAESKKDYDINTNKLIDAFFCKNCS